MARKESVLGALQLDHLEIEKFIFHVIDPDKPLEERVIYLDEVDLAKDQILFFKGRLKAASTGTQYVFIDEAGGIKEKCKSILADSAKNFVSVSKEMARDFAKVHDKATAPGVFIVAVAKTLLAEGRPIRLIFLVKIDHKDAHQYKLKNVNGQKKATMEKLINSLVEDRAAIQKSALIDPSDSFAWDVLGTERTPPKEGGIRDYFKNFLEVKLRESPSELTRRVMSVATKWARALPDDQRPETEDANTYKARAAQYLKDHTSFDTDSFINTVVRDEDPKRKEILKGSLLEKLREAGVAGQQFSPTPNSLPKAYTRHTYKTHEGVVVQFEGTLEAMRIKIKKTANGEIMTIESSSISVVTE